MPNDNTQQALSYRKITERLGLRRRHLPERGRKLRRGQCVLVQTGGPLRRRGWIKSVRGDDLVVEYAGGAEARVSRADVSAEGSRHG